MRVGYYQFEPVFGEVFTNLERVAAELEIIDCDLVVLPELAMTGYQFLSPEETWNLAEPIPEGPTTTRCLELAKARSMIMVVGLAERAGTRCYNSAVVVGPSGLIGVYRKVHLFAEETLFFTSGDTGFPVWNIGEATIGVLICFDWIYPEAARTLALKGADLLCHPANLVLPYCPDAMVTRCLENRVFSITANRVGSEARGGKPRLSFIGQSEIVSPSGTILHRAPSGQSELYFVDIDVKEARQKRITPYNDLFRDRRPSCYFV
ncbi:MAG: acyltransferase [Nitrospirae bacterium]|nr:MAG: acyltransferase [Nitrospirota bacterium]